MKTFYRTLKTINGPDGKIYPGNIICSESPETVKPLVASGYIEETTISAPSSHCTWCGGSEYWLNWRGKFICEHCYPPISFPGTSVKVYDRFTVGD